MLILGSCKTEKTQDSFPEENIIGRLAIPIRLGHGLTTLYPMEFLTDLSILDSMGAPSGTSVKTYGKYDSIHLVGNPKSMVSNLTLFTRKGEFDIPVFASKKIEHTLTFDDRDKKYSSIIVKGSMNGWSTNRDFMEYTNGSWNITFLLNPGKYAYRLILDGEEKIDPQNDKTEDNGFGSLNSIFMVGDPNTRKPNVQSLNFDGTTIRMIYDHDNTEVLAYWQNHLINYNHLHNSGDTLIITIPSDARKEERSYLRVYSANSDQIGNDLLIPLHYGEVLTNTDHLNRKDQHGFIMYFMMVDRFLNGNPENDMPVDDPEILPQANYKGGDIIGVTQKIKEGYFADLGMNTVWLSPINTNPKGAWGLWTKEVRSKYSGYHGYWPISNTAIDPRMGRKSDLTDLIAAAHLKNENVLLDYVANHVHQEHPVVEKHPDWVTPLYLPDGTMNTAQWDDHRLTTWFDTFLPTLELRKPEVTNAMTDSAVYWFKNYDIDGFRHDATKHIPELYWRTLNYKLRKEVMMPQNRPIYQIGETYGNPELISSYISTGMLDAQFDFNFYDACITILANDERSFEDLKMTFDAGLEAYGSHHLMGNITGNQDRPRFISLADGSVRFDEDTKLAGWTRNIQNKSFKGFQKLALLHCINMSVPGIPVIYYGDEIGLPGGNDPDNRRMMIFDDLDEDQLWLKDLVASLAKYRSGHPEMLYGSSVMRVPQKDLLIIERRYFDHKSMIIINKSNDALTADHIEKLEPAILSDPATQVSKGKINIQPNSFIILSNMP